MKKIVLVSFITLFFPVMVSGQSSLLENTTADKGLNYVILDAASWDTDINQALSRNEVNASLYNLRGAEQGLESVAPYLFKFPEDIKERKSFDNWLVRKYDSQHRALYVHSEASLHDLRRHLSVYTRARTDSGQEFFFRFYDPAVACYLFQVLTVEQLAMFFSQVNYIAYTDPYTDKDMVVAPSEAVLQYARDNTVPKFQTLEFSASQMDQISRLMQEHKSLEPAPATCNLSGRNVSGELPLPVYEKESDARVQVDISVNREGKVTKATSVQQGGSLLNMAIKKAAEEAAMKTRFDANSDAPATQVGNIIYRFDKIR